MIRKKAEFTARFLYTMHKKSFSILISHLAERIISGVGRAEKEPKMRRCLRLIFAFACHYAKKSAVIYFREGILFTKSSQLCSKISG